VHHEAIEERGDVGRDRSFPVLGREELRDLARYEDSSYFPAKRDIERLEGTGGGLWP
jgi:hypothetical protein